MVGKIFFSLSFDLDNVLFCFGQFIWNWLK